jgi:transposase
MNSEPDADRAANRRLAQHLWAHRDDLLTFLRQPGLDATDWRAELAIRFGVILRKVWRGSRTWVGARAQSVLMSVWRTCWQQGRSAVDFLSRVLRGTPAALAFLPPELLELSEALLDVRDV